MSIAFAIRPTNIWTYVACNKKKRKWNTHPWHYVNLLLCLRSGYRLYSTPHCSLHFSAVVFFFSPQVFPQIKFVSLLMPVAAFWTFVLLCTWRKCGQVFPVTQQSYFEVENRPARLEASRTEFHQNCVVEKPSYWLNSDLLLLHVHKSQS